MSQECVMAPPVSLAAARKSPMASGWPVSSCHTLIQTTYLSRPTALLLVLVLLVLLPPSAEVEQGLEAGPDLVGDSLRRARSVDHDESGWICGCNCKERLPNTFVKVGLFGFEPIEPLLSILES